LRRLEGVQALVGYSRSVQATRHLMDTKRKKQVTSPSSEREREEDLARQQVTSLSSERARERERERERERGNTHLLRRLEGVQALVFQAFRNLLHPHSGLVTLPNIGVPHYIAVPHRREIGNLLPNNQRQRRTCLRIVPHSVPRVSHSCELFPDGFDLHLLLPTGICEV